MNTATERLKSTSSYCESCRKLVPARVEKRTGTNKDEIWMVKACADCGERDTRLSSDARFYWLSQGSREDSDNSCGTGCGCGPQSWSPPPGLSRFQTPSASGERIGFLGGNALRPLPVSNPIEVMSTCLALIEIVHSCNLRCPTCFADSPPGTGEQVDAVLLTDIQSRVEGVIQRKGRIEILQLSGGEPTLHPQFFELVRWCQEHPDIDYVLVNSNGVRLAGEPTFGERLRECITYGKFQFYLQYDGPSALADELLRGADLRRMKEKAIERAGELGIPLTLAMTVIPENLEQLWSTVSFGLAYDHVRGVAFQPYFGSGRIPSAILSGQKLNVADIINGLIAQSDGLVSADDFTPLPCGDPNCATIGYLLKVEGAVRSISDFVDFGTLQGFLSDRIRYRLEDLIQCGCESEPLAELLHDLEMDESHTFRLFIKPFMDERDWDQDRIDRCCTHVIRPDGVLDSFCRYYLNGGAKPYVTA